MRLEKIWDPVTRLWHWVLVAVVGTGWYYGEFMSFATISWHFYLGYGVLGLLAFRVLWGVVGPSPVRLRALFPSPAAVRDSLREIRERKPSGSPGHSALGSLSVLAMLLALITQALTGLFIESEDYFESAPFAHLVSSSVGNNLLSFHHLMAKVILVLVILHVAAILFYWIWKKENLVKPMLTGWKQVKSD